VDLAVHHSEQFRGFEDGVVERTEADT